MKKVICLLTACAMSLFIAQCSQFGPESQADSGSTKSVMVSIKVPPSFDTLMKSATVRVSADGMNTIESPLNFQDTVISGIVNKIPVGKNRHFEVFVYNYFSEVEYYGSAYADIYSGDTTYVWIVLKKPLGTAVINGTIEEVGTITPPATPWIQWANISADTGVEIKFQTEPCTSTTMAPAFYIFEFWSTYDSAYSRIKSTAPWIISTFPLNGDYFCDVVAKANWDSTISAKSGTMHFNINNGIVTSDNPGHHIDTLDTIDTIPPVITFPWSADTMFITKGDTLDLSSVTAFDSHDGYRPCTLTGNVNWGVPDQYDIVFKATDLSGNTAQKRLVIVIQKKKKK